MHYRSANHCFVLRHLFFDGVHLRHHKQGGRVSHVERVCVCVDADDHHQFSPSNLADILSYSISQEVHFFGSLVRVLFFPNWSFPKFWHIVLTFLGTHYTSVFIHHNFNKQNEKCFNQLKVSTATQLLGAMRFY